EENPELKPVPARAGIEEMIPGAAALLDFTETIKRNDMSEVAKERKPRQHRLCRHAINARKDFISRSTFQGRGHALVIAVRIVFRVKIDDERLRFLSIDLDIEVFLDARHFFAADHAAGRIPNRQKLGIDLFNRRRAL